MLSFLYKIIFLILLLSIACGTRNGGGKNLTKNDLKEPLIEENIKLNQEERRLINHYAERHNWVMETTGSGLMYMVYQKGSGIQAESGMEATVEYEIKLLDGTLCYTSLESGPRKFLIGRDHVESGIHEGIMLMHVGDHAKFIIPSYLAHGLTGDNNKIPPRSSLVVDLHLMRLD